MLGIPVILWFSKNFPSKRSPEEDPELVLYMEEKGIEQPETVKEIHT
jgi:hypothetical protein